MVHVADRDLRLHGRQAQCLELQVDHGARGILGQGLIDGQADLRARLHLAFDQVLPQDLLGNCVLHGLNP